MSFGDATPSSSTSTVTVAPATEPVPYDPKEAPPVPRPDVPDTTEAPAPGIEDTIMGNVASVLDRYVPDDMGGVARGESGWLSMVPGYRQTVGAVAGLVLSGGESVMNAMYFGSEQSDHLMAWLNSALPGGIDTLDMEWTPGNPFSFDPENPMGITGQVTQLSANQAMASNIGRYFADYGAPLIRSQFNDRQYEQFQSGLQSTMLFMADDFDPLDPEQKRVAFEEQFLGRTLTGVGDAVWDVFGDPTIVGGKASSVLRYGTKAGKFGGLANGSLNTVEKVSIAGDRIDQTVAYVATGGREGKWDALGEHVKNLISEPVDALDNNVFVKNSNDPLLVKRLAGQVDSEDYATGAALAKALMGDASGWASLRERSVSLYDQLANGAGIDPLELLPGRAELTADQLAYGQQMVGDLLAAGQVVTRSGGRSVTMARLANAYRRGVAQNQFGKTTARVTEEPPVTPNGGWASTVVQATAASRPVRVIRWLGQGTPTGIVHLKGGDGTSSLNEVSAFLRKSEMSGDDATRLYAEFVQAQTPTAKRNVLIAMEKADIRATAAKNGVSAEVAEAMYESYAKERGRHLATLRQKQNAFAVDETGELVTTPELYTELDEAFPMLNQRIFKRVTKANMKWLRNVEDLELVIDTANSWWKLSVLLRLGYTQRNITEGFLRSVAVLGMAASNPEAFKALPANLRLAAKARGYKRTSRTLSKSLDQAQSNLAAARKELLEARAAAGVDDMFKARAEAASFREAARKLERVKNRTKKQEKELARLIEKRDRAQSLADELKATQVDPAVAGLTRLSAREQELLAQIDELSSQMLDAQAGLKNAYRGKKKLGYSENVMPDGSRMSGAFEGPEGDIARLLSSADSSTAMTFDSAYEARKAAMESSERWRPLDPRTMSPEDMTRYWDEYATRLNQRYRNDPIVKMWLDNDANVSGQYAGNVVEDAKRLLMSREGAYLRESLSVDGRRLQTASGAPREAAIEEYLTELWHRYSREIPQDTGLRKALSEGAITPDEARAAFRNMEPPAIPARVIDDGPAPHLATKLHTGARSFADKIMYGLGTWPENFLLRHPFYNSVYKTRQRELWMLAKNQGADMASGTVKARINKAAHRDALQATRSTMYTIERLSNTANLLRWVSPFFPAFENSVRVWGRLAYQNPAVLGAGALLWNVPNSLGWVYDKDGNKVELSSMFKDEGNYIVWPEAVQQMLTADLPGPIDDMFLPGEAVMTRQAGFNVVFQGGEWWWPGVGAMTQVPTALFLRDKPETTDILRSMVGEEMFRNIVPNGDPNTDLVEVMLPTVVRRLKQSWNGTSEDGAYLTLHNTMIEDAYIQAQIDGRTLGPDDMKAVRAKADRFWNWTIQQAAGAFTSSSLYMSPFKAERDAWQAMMDDQSMTYQQKLDAFIETYGTEFAAIGRSGSVSQYGVQPNLSTWQKIYKNPDLIGQLSNIDPELVGMFANMGSWDDPFSYSVYGEFKTMTIGDDGKPLRHSMTPEQIVRNNEIADGWRQWRLVTAGVEEKAAAAGFKSVQQKGAEQFQQILDDAEAELKTTYPAWGQEKEVYADKLPLFISGARLMVENGNLVGEDTTIRALSEYLKVRDYVARMKDRTDDRDTRAALNQIGYAAAAELRQQDIGFADFYDRYLVRDDFRVV